MLGPYVPPSLWLRCDSFCSMVVSVHGMLAISVVPLAARHLLQALWERNMSMWWMQRYLTSGLYPLLPQSAFHSVPKRFGAHLVMQKLCKLACFIAPNEDLMLFNWCRNQITAAKQHGRSRATNCWYSKGQDKLCESWTLLISMCCLSFLTSNFY